MLSIRIKGQPMAAYRLHYFPESGNSYKLALMLTLCGQDWEPVWTDFGGGITRTVEWRRQVNEMGEIPVLEDSGKRHTQTAPILLRLAERYGRFGGRDDDERFEILRWLFWDNHKLTGYMATYRFFARLHAISRTQRARLHAQTAGRLSGHHRAALSGSAFRGREPADDRRSLDDRLPVISFRRNRLRPGDEPSGRAGLAVSRRGYSRLAGTLRFAAGQAAAQLRVNIGVIS
jgi:glutathione S-transferase